MDATVKKSNETYKLINNVTGKIEAEGLRRIEAKDEQNMLWARGIKCNLFLELS